MSTDNSKMCRLCLVEAEVMCPIFNSYSKINPQSVALPQRIMSFAQIKVAEDDGLPSSICYQCLAQVDKSYQFKLQCEQSDALLRQNLQEQLENDSDHGDWEMMKFTPEVIIDEGEGHSDDINDSQDSQPCESDSDNSMTQAQNGTYPLSQVQALLRHHGTEIKLQGGRAKGRDSSKQGESDLNDSYTDHNNSYSEHNDSHNSNGNGHSNHGQMEYFPFYGVEAMLNSVPLGSNGSTVTHHRPIMPRLPVSSTSLSSLLNRKGELRPELTLISPNGMQKSRRSRDGQKLFQCRLCPKSYSFSSALSRHKAVHNTELRPHVCTMCKKGFADPEKLERHMRTHVSDQLFPCNICGRVFKALATFERHKLMTQGKCRQYSCMLCGLGFPNKTKLKLHPCRAAPHQRLYPCPQCNEVLNTREAFESHVASHSGLSERAMNSQSMSLVTSGDTDRRSI